MVRFLGDNFCWYLVAVVLWFSGRGKCCWCYNYRGAVGCWYGECAVEGLMCACVLRGVFDNVER